jgi:hypothetical protein
MTNKLTLTLALALIALSMPLLAAPPGSAQLDRPAITAQAGVPVVANQAAASTALPVWALPTQPSSPQTLEANDGTPLFLTSCSGCTGAACTRLHSCVLLHCC